MGIHFEGQLNVWEINLNNTATQEQSEQMKHLEFCQMPRVSLTRIWWSNTRVYNDLQPFSICELRSKPYQLTHIELERVEGDAVIGCDGGVLLFFSMSALRKSLTAA